MFDTRHRDVWPPRPHHPTGDKWHDPRMDSRNPYSSYTRYHPNQNPWNRHELDYYMMGRRKESPQRTYGRQPFTSSPGNGGYSPNRERNSRERRVRSPSRRDRESDNRYTNRSDGAFRRHRFRSRSPHRTMNDLSDVSSSEGSFDSPHKRSKHSRDLRLDRLDSRIDANGSKNEKNTTRTSPLREKVLRNKEGKNGKRDIPYKIKSVVKKAKFEDDITEKGIYLRAEKCKADKNNNKEFKSPERMVVASRSDNADDKCDLTISISEKRTPSERSPNKNVSKENIKYDKEDARKIKQKIAGSKAETSEENEKEKKMLEAIKLMSEKEKVIKLRASPKYDDNDGQLKTVDSGKESSQCQGTPTKILSKEIPIRSDEKDNGPGNKTDFKETANAIEEKDNESQSTISNTPVTGTITDNFVHSSIHYFQPEKTQVLNETLSKVAETNDLADVIRKFIFKKNTSDVKETEPKEVNRDVEQNYAEKQETKKDNELEKKSVPSCSMGENVEITLTKNKEKVHDRLPKYQIRGKEVEHHRLGSEQTLDKNKTDNKSHYCVKHHTDKPDQKDKNKPDNKSLNCVKHQTDESDQKGKNKTDNESPNCVENQTHKPGQSSSNVRTSVCIKGSFNKLNTMKKPKEREIEKEARVCLHKIDLTLTSKQKQGGCIQNIHVKSVAQSEMDKVKASTNTCAAIRYRRQSGIDKLSPKVQPESKAEQIRQRRKSAPVKLQEENMPCCDKNVESKECNTLLVLSSNKTSEKCSEKLVTSPTSTILEQKKHRPGLNEYIKLGKSVKQSHNSNNVKRKVSLLKIDEADTIVQKGIKEQETIVLSDNLDGKRDTNQAPKANSKLSTTLENSESTIQKDKNTKNCDRHIGPLFNKNKRRESHYHQEDKSSQLLDKLKHASKEVSQIKGGHSPLKKKKYQRLKSLKTQSRSLGHACQTSNLNHKKKPPQDIDNCNAEEDIDTSKNAESNDRGGKADRKNKEAHKNFTETDTKDKIVAKHKDKENSFSRNLWDKESLPNGGGNEKSSAIETSQTPLNDTKSCKNSTESQVEGMDICDNSATVTLGTHTTLPPQPPTYRKSLFKTVRTRSFSGSHKKENPSNCLSQQPTVTNTDILVSVRKANSVNENTDVNEHTINNECDKNESEINTEEINGTYTAEPMEMNDDDIDYDDIRELHDIGQGECRIVDESKKETTLQKKEIDLPLEEQYTKVKYCDDTVLIPAKSSNTTVTKRETKRYGPILSKLGLEEESNETVNENEETVKETKQQKQRRRKKPKSEKMVEHLSDSDDSDDELLKHSPLKNLRLDETSTWFEKARRNLKIPTPESKQKTKQIAVENDSESEPLNSDLDIEILPTSTDFEKVSKHVYENGFEVRHDKVLKDDTMLTTRAHLDPERLYVNSNIDKKKLGKCLLCRVCSCFFTPLDFTVHHDTIDTELMDVGKCNLLDYTMDEPGEEDMKRVFKNFQRYFHGQRDKRKSVYSALKLPYASNEVLDDTGFSGQMVKTETLKKLKKPTSKTPQPTAKTPMLYSYLTLPLKDTNTDAGYACSRPATGVMQAVSNLTHLSSNSAETNSYDVGDTGNASVNSSFDVNDAESSAVVANRSPTTDQLSVENRSANSFSPKGHEPVTESELTDKSLMPVQTPEKDTTGTPTTSPQTASEKVQVRQVVANTDVPSAPTKEETGADLNDTSSGTPRLTIPDSKRDAYEEGVNGLCELLGISTKSNRMNKYLLGSIMQIDGVREMMTGRKKKAGHL